MEKLDKKALIQQLSYEGKSIKEINGFKNGLEYAENHYFKIIKKKDKEINRIQKLGEEVLEAYDYNTAKLQQAKKLLKEMIKFAPGYKNNVKDLLNTKLKEKAPGIDISEIGDEYN